MSITKQQALTETVFHHNLYTQAKGKQCETWRRNGRTKTWKTRPLEFQIPVKWGLKTYDYIQRTSSLQHSNDSAFHLPKDCPRLA